jgi:hypothetical protein
MNSAMLHEVVRPFPTGKSIGVKQNVQIKEDKNFIVTSTGEDRISRCCKQTIKTCQGKKIKAGCRKTNFWLLKANTLRRLSDEKEE